MKLKLFVWTGVLSDYTSGMVAVLAANETAAWKLLKDKDKDAWMNIRGNSYVDNADADKRLPKSLPAACRPKVITNPAAFVVWGGG